MSMLKAATSRALESNKKVKTEQDLDCRDVLACAATTNGYTITGAKTPGSIADDIKNVVLKHKKCGHVFGKLSVGTFCFDGARMNDNPVIPITIASYNLAIISAAMTQCSLCHTVGLLFNRRFLI